MHLPDMAAEVTTIQMSNECSQVRFAQSFENSLICQLFSCSSWLTWP